MQKDTMKLQFVWIVLLIVFFAASPVLMSCTTMEDRAKTYVEKALSKIPTQETSSSTGTVITENDLVSFPPVVQRYLRYSGVVGKRRISSFSIILEGRIRNGPDEPWMPLGMRQFNRIDVPARIVYLESDAPPMAGVDSFVGASGRMHIKVMNIITVADSTGPEMNRSAFVTFLNDLVLCPIAYFSLPIKWTQLDERRAELSMTHEGLEVKAILSFDSDGRILNWESEDRYAEVKGKSLKDRWSTPFSGSAELSGLMIPASGVGIHDYDGRPFVYVELDRIQSLVLNAPGLPPRQ